MDSAGRTGRRVAIASIVTSGALAVLKIQAFWEFVRGRRRWGRIERTEFAPRPAGATAS